VNRYKTTGTWPGKLLALWLAAWFGLAFATGANAATFDFSNNSTTQTVSGVTVTATTDSGGWLTTNGGELYDNSNQGHRITFTFSKPIIVSDFQVGFYGNSGAAGPFAIDGVNGIKSYTYSKNPTYSQLDSSTSTSSPPPPHYTANLSTDSGWGNVTVTSITVRNLGSGSVSYIADNINFTVPAASVPGSPTGVSATAGNATANVTFTAPASNGGAAITTYTATASPGGKTGSCAGPSACTIAVNGLTNGTTYTFTVTATNSTGTSAPSSPSATVTPKGPPGAPTGVTATGGNTQATVNFTAPASDGGSAITKYTATASPGGKTGSCSGPSACAITVTGLTNGTAYTFTVTATNALGTGPASSPSSAVTPATIPGAPTGVSASAGNATANVTFTAPGSNGGAAITTYTATASPGGKTGSCAGPSACTIAVNGLTNGTAYTFTVTATNSTGTSAPSSPSAAVTPKGPPDAPTGVTATSSNHQATVNFTAPASDGGSAITTYTATASPGGFTGSCAGPGACTITVSGLTNGTSYTFTVTATNTIGTSAASTPSSAVKPTTTPPGAPTAVTASAANAQATISFTAPTYDGGSSIQTYTATASPGGQTGTCSGPAACNITVTGLTDGTSYTFTVTATNAIGTSAASAASAPVTPAPQVPGAPTGVKAAAGNAQATITFTAPASDGGSAITTYTATSNPNGLTGSCKGPAACTITVKGLINTAYTFTVTATNAIGAGAASAPSNSVTPTATPVSGSATMQYRLNTPVTVDLASVITGTSIKITTPPKHGMLTVTGTQVTYMPVQGFFGSDSFAYASIYQGATSPASVVTIQFVGTRPDPRNESNVGNLINLQTETAKRFAQTQITNFRQRLESLHHDFRSPTDSAGGVRTAPGALAMTTDSQNFTGEGEARSRTTPDYAVQTGPSGQNNGGISPGMASRVLSILANSAVSLNVATLAGSDRATGNSNSGFSFWAAGNVRIGKTRQPGGGSRIDYTTNGISMGADRQFSRYLTVGLGFGYAHDKSTVGSDGTGSSTYGGNVALYASYQPGSPLFFDGLLGYGTLSMDASRYVATFNEVARSSRQGSLLFGSLTSGYDYRGRHSLLSPYVRYSYSRVHLDPATETGSGVSALYYASQISRSQQVALGLRAELQETIRPGRIHPRARVEYQHHFDDNSRTSIAYADLRNTSYAMAFPGSDTDSLLLGIGSTLELHDGLALDIDYQWVHSSANDNSQGIFGRLNKAF